MTGSIALPPKGEEYQRSQRNDHSRVIPSMHQAVQESTLPVPGIQNP